MERMIVEINQYFHQLLRMRDDYVMSREDAKLTVSDIIKKKYATMTNCEYLERDFDFYALTFRL